MNITDDDFVEITCGHHPDFETVKPEYVTDTSRWSISYKMVAKHVETGRYYQFLWESGATEYQDMPFAESAHDYWEVEPVEVTVTEYRRVR